MITAIFLATVAVAVLDYAMPTVNLSPLSFIFVIAMSAVAGLTWGLGLAAVAALSFTLADSSQGFVLHGPLFIDSLILFAALATTAVLVDVSRRRFAAGRMASEDLEQSRAEIEALRQLHVAQEEVRLVERRYRELGESLPFGIWQLDAAGTNLLYVSESFCKMLGVTKEQILDTGWLQRMNPQDREPYIAAWNARDPDRVFEAEYRIRAADGKQYWILSRGVAMRDEKNELSGWVGFSLDVTARRQGAEQVAFLAELSRVLSLSLDPATTLERTAALMVPRVADWYAVDLLTEDSAVERVLMVHADPQLTMEARALVPHAPRDLSFPKGAPLVIATGRPATYDRLPSDAVAQLSDDDPLRESLDAIALRSAIVVPLVARDRTIGALTFISSDAERHFDADDLLFAYLISRRVAIAYDNARLYAREHQVADILQRASLPETLPEVPSVSIRAHYVPGASEAEIGGDWYDAFQLPDGRLALSIGDVAGKGLQAAATMNGVRLGLRAAAFENLPPAAIMARVNHMLLNDRPTMVTAVFGILDAVTQRFTCSIAGHPVPVLIDASGSVTSPEPVAPPLGVFRESTFPEQVLDVGLGSLLILFTDGLIEVDHDISGGEARLRDAGRLALSRGEQNAARFIAEMLVGDSPNDDVAILTLATSAHPLRELDLSLPAQPSSGRLFRYALHRLYLAVGLPNDRIASMQVAAGEAIMNAIEHAYGIRGGLVRVRGKVEIGKLVIEVSDRGRWRAPRDDDRGRGLKIMSGLVDQVTVDHSKEGTVVKLVSPVYEGAL